MPSSAQRPFGDRIEIGVSGKTVLVVDDDKRTVEFVELYLNRDGHKVLKAYDGVETLCLARKEHPDLIVLDLMLPAMDGFEICRTLMDESAVPIIILTAKTTKEDKLKDFGLGVDDYVTKPFKTLFDWKEITIYCRYKEGILDR